MPHTWAPRLDLRVMFQSHTFTWCTNCFPWWNQGQVQQQTLQCPCFSCGKCWLKRRYFCWYQPCNIHRSSQLRCFKPSTHWTSIGQIEMLHCIQEWYESKDFARVMASSRELLRYGEGPKFTSGTSESNTSNTCAKHIDDCKVGAEEWLVQNFELSKDFTLAN